MKNNQEKISIIYLLGAGRSGSTILDLVMDSHSQIFGIGEFFKYYRLKKKNYPCTCGKSLNDCSFWKKVFQNIDLKDSLEICRTKIDFLLNRKKYFDAYHRCPINIKKYIELNEKIYENILKHSGKKLVFDSSKHPQRAELLLDSDKLDITILHLVRNGKGVSWSYRDKGGNIFKSMYLWLITNLKIEIIKRRNKVKYIFIRYEDFVKNPELILDSILKKAGLCFEPEMMNFRNKEHHQVGGNVLTRLGKESKIRGNFQWKKQMPLFYKLIFNLFFDWLNLIYKNRKSL